MLFQNCHVVDIQSFIWMHQFYHVVFHDLFWSNSLLFLTICSYQRIAQPTYGKHLRQQHGVSNKYISWTSLSNGSTCLRKLSWAIRSSIATRSRISIFRIKTIGGARLRRALNFFWDKNLKNQNLPVLCRVTMNYNDF